MKQPESNGQPHDDGPKPYDYAHVDSVARIALYDDLLSAPHVIEIQPAPTAEFIESLSSAVYNQSKAAGGTIPYTVIREVSENFIHAKFAEATVSILDGGNTIRFADQGPGIPFKDRVQLPGFTSATEPMKSYIRGVGSGLPIVKEYLEFSHGTISIEDNLGTGSVVTISLKPQEGSEAPGSEAVGPEQGASAPGEAPYANIGRAYQAEQAAIAATPAGAPGAYAAAPAAGMPGGAALPAQAPATAPYPTAYPYAAPQPAAAPAAYPPASAYPAYNPYAPAAQPQAGWPPAAAGMAAPAHAQHAAGSLAPALTQRERDFLPIFLHEGALGVTDIVRLTGVPQSSTHSVLVKLEQAGLIEKTAGQKRILTDFGYQVANTL